MKRKVVGLAVGLMCEHAFAQNSVTLYGMLDNGITYATNAGGARQLMQQSSIMRGNRWGMTGKEDLGGGLRAIFTIEGGLNLENGTAAQGGLEFGRQAFVGLANRFGTIALGRQYDFIVDYVGASFSSSLYNTSYAFHAGDIDRLSGQRADSAIKLYSANLSGFTFGAMYAYGDPSTRSPDTNRVVSFGGHFERGGFSAGAAYTAVYDQAIPLATVFGVTSLFGKTIGAVNPKTGVIAGPSINVDRTQTIALGAGYKWTKFTLLGLVTGNKLVIGTNSGNFMTYEATGSYSPSPFFFIAASYAFETFQGERYGMAAATIDYRLSVRTDLYAALVNLRGYDGAAAAIHAITISSSNMQTVFRVGIRHLF
ncbi:outer membrane protein OmpU [Paraburkholderia sp. BL6669N2]|uniref:porin n=1 Tax=Paraburkholderia sp. BL6669N2 TaxID=1938807 RepID=UPI000E220D48|nr:porin [Paraburkholderia sp. BL6669N2]REG50982.1 outer membrane protein OmpU [Paraburkholderia sp. BL6669N2]